MSPPVKQIHIQENGHAGEPKLPSPAPPQVPHGSPQTTRFNSIRQTIPLTGNNRNKRFKRSMTGDQADEEEDGERQRRKRLSTSGFGRQRHSLQAASDEEQRPASDVSSSVEADRKSPNSPAWCSTSDSAFSHSQTTLGSESGNSSNSLFARRSMKGCSSGYSENSSASTISDKSIVSSKEELTKNQQPPNSSPPDEGAAEDENGDFFNIIWKNLSYKVPEKRFSKSKAFLKRHCKYLFAEEAAIELEEEATSGGSSPPTIAANGKPPLRAPTTGKPRRIIFQNLNGCVKSGQLTAILGPSGAGKTTLLKCLTNSIVEGVSGQIDIVDRKANNKPATSSQHLKLCIIPQKDYLFDNLTVMENLVFASRIKNTQVNFNHLDNVDRVANLLGLQPCLKLKTGKLSGGQYKRVSIAQELLSKPDILILDEPTSGLDSLTCFKTVSVLRDLVDKSQAGLIPPLAIVMTIHQPQIKIFNLFHQVYIMSSLGQCVYEGRPEYLLDTVFDCCKLTPPPDDANPASFIIDLASEVYGIEPIEKLINFQHKQSTAAAGREPSSDDDENQNIVPISLIESNLKNSPLSLVVVGDAKKLDRSCCLEEGGAICSVEVLNNSFASNLQTRPTANKLQISDRLKRRNIHDGNFWLHTNLLVKRLWKSTWRDPLLTKTRLIFHITIPFVFYFIYSQKSGAANACPQVEREFNFKSMASSEYVERLGVQHNELILTYENVSLFFLLLYSFSMCVLAVTALSFPLNMQILLKETSNGWYSMPRFVMAKTLADLPMELTMPIISVSIAYYLTGQPSSYLCWRMLAVTAVMTLCSLISQTQGLLFGAYFMNNVQAAVFISQASSLPWIMLSGFTTRVSELPTLLQWLSFGSIYRLGIESIVSIRYGYNMCPCDAEIVDSGPARVVGIPDQLRSLMRYYMDVYGSDSGGGSVSESLAAINQTTTTTLAPTIAANSGGDVFEQIASTLSRANTYGVDIVNCGDVRPYILTAREVDEGTLPIFLLILFCILVALKILLFCIITQ